MTLEIMWYLVVIVAMICYAILDGFDLGVGSLHLFTKKDEDRRVFLNAIGPVWDGNEVWLVIVGGALFAGFPEIYATVFSAFYNFVMLLLCGLIFRAVAIEFRSKMASERWRHAWDVVFSVASLIIAFGIGVVFGNIIEGIPLNENRDFIGNTLGFIRPYSLLVGLMTVALFMMHGSIYLVMKTQGALHGRLRQWVNKTIIFFIVTYVFTTLATLLYMPHMTERMRGLPWLFLIPLLSVFAILNIPVQLGKGNDGWAFISSSVSIASLLSLFSIGTFPIIVRSSLNPESFSLTILNAASSTLTLKVLLIIVVIGVPLVLAYGFYIYRIFRGKVRLDKHSY